MRPNGIFGAKSKCSPHETSRWGRVLRPALEKQRDSSKAKKGGQDTNVIVDFFNRWVYWMANLATPIRAFSFSEVLLGSKRPSITGNLLPIRSAGSRTFSSCTRSARSVLVCLLNRLQYTFPQCRRGGYLLIRIPWPSAMYRGLRRGWRVS